MAADITLHLNANEPNPTFMMYQEIARPIILKALMGKGKCFWVKGETGIGKSTFLLWLKEFSPIYKLKPIFFHAGEKKGIDDFKKMVAQVISPSFFPRLFSRSKATNKPIILIIDDLEYLANEDIFQYISSQLDNPDINLSVVFSSNESEQKINQIFKGKAVEEVNLAMPPKDIVMDMVNKRIEVGGGKKFQPFGVDLVEKIVDESKTPREVLKKLEDAHKKKRGDKG